MSRKQLEIQLSQLIQPFDNPKITFEQYQTPPRVAANLLHIAWTRDHIEERSVVDLCAGTGILGIGASLLHASVTLVEKEDSAFQLLQSNLSKISGDIEAVQADVLRWKPSKRYDTAILNPPFGIQQKSTSDMDFVNKAAKVADHIYAIHDGSQANQDKLPDLYKDRGLDIIEAYIDEFPLDNKYPWHKMKRKIHKVLIIHSSSS